MHILKSSKGWDIPTKPTPMVTQRKEMVIVGTLYHKVRNMDKRVMEEVGEFEENAKVKLQKMVEDGDTDISTGMQHIGERLMDESFVGMRIELLANFDMDDEGTKKELCYGVVLQ